MDKTNKRELKAWAKLFKQIEDSSKLKKIKTEREENGSKKEKPISKIK